MKNKLILSILIMFSLLVYTMSVEAVYVHINGEVNASGLITTGNDLCVKGPNARQCATNPDNDADIRLEPYVSAGPGNGSSIFANPKGFMYINTHAKGGIINVTSQDGSSTIVPNKAKVYVDGILTVGRGGAFNDIIDNYYGLRVSGPQHGIYGNSIGTDGSYNYGVYGIVSGGSGTTASGVYGYVSASNASHSKIIGVEGKVGGTSSGIKKGIVATLDGSTSTSDYAIEGYVSTGSGYSIYASGGSGIKIYSGDVRIENGAVCVDDDYFCTPGIKGEIDAAKFNVNSNPDIAEMFYTPNVGGGDVVCITQANTFGWCNENDYRVAGIVSTTPGFLLNSKCGGHNAVEVRARDIQDGVYDHEGNRISDNELIGYGDDPNACVGWLPIALQGRVPAKVDCSNAISPGDRLVTSSTNGHLKKYMGENAGDLLVAKALESCASGTSVIDVWI